MLCNQGGNISRKGVRKWNQQKGGRRPAALQATDICRRVNRAKSLIAFKFEDDMVETVFRSIKWTPSCSGEIAPVALFDPVEIGGCTVSRASLHIKKRLETLRTVDEMEHVEIEFDGGMIVTNEEINRVQIIFNTKPDEAVRRELKSWGFRWSPREGAWQAQRTPRYLHRAKRICHAE